MKYIISISFNILMLFVFTAAPTNYGWACGKVKCSKETVQHKSKCQKDCCKTPHSNSKTKKKGCCEDNCSCSASITISADLPKYFNINLTQRPVPVERSTFFYKQAFQNFSIQDIWQPPITVLST